MVRSSIEKCDPELRKEFYENILITGGNSMISGYTDRLQRELSIVSDNRSVLEVRKERLYSTWIGASLLASMSTFREL
jgi:actin-related protein